MDGGYSMTIRASWRRRRFRSPRLVSPTFSKQFHLTSRTPELRAVQLPSLFIQPVFFCIPRILLCHQPGYIPFSAHTHSPPAIVDLAIMARLDKMPDLIGPVGKTLIEPVAEDQLYGTVETDKSIG